MLEEVDEDKRGQYLKLLPKKSQRELVKKGLKFPEDTAGRIMSTNVVSVSASWTIGKTLKFLRQKSGFHCLSPLWRLYSLPTSL